MSFVTVICSITQTVIGFISSPLPQKLRSPLFRIKAKTIQVPGENDPHHIIKGESVHVPAKTARITVHGTYFIHPHAANYALFVRIGKSYWAHDRIEFSAHGKWQGTVGFGRDGEHFIIVARLSPELEVLHGYYRKVVHQIETDKTQLAAQLPEQYRQLVKTIGSSTAIEVQQYMPGLKRLHEFTVIVGEA